MLVRRRQRLAVPALALTGVAAGVLAGLSPLSAAVAISCVVTSVAGARLEIETSLPITAMTVSAFLVAGIVAGSPVQAVLGYPLALIGLWAFGMSRRAFLVRAEQAEQMLLETRRAREAETRAAALAERARIAREIHDVLAHSLAAVSVNLQAAEGLLTTGTLPAGNQELARAIECIGRASSFTREGLAEARRAILALRDDVVPGEPADWLVSLATEHRAAGDSAVDFGVTGTPRPVPAEAGLAVYRTAQEVLTNARKHAPRQPVRLCLDYEDGSITLTVTNPLSPPAVARPLAATGAGFGLTGLSERAALAGGTLDAGESCGQWRVLLRIPG